MKSKFFILTTIILLALPSYAGAPLIGYSGFSNKVFQRIFVPSNDVELLDLFYFETRPQSFKKFLGVYEATPGNDEITNGQPNALTMTLYAILADNISSTVAKVCRQSIIDIEMIVLEDQSLLVKPELRPELETVVSKLCQWPLAAGEEGVVLEELLNQVSLFDLPEKERDAWISHFLSGSYHASTPTSLIYDMIYTLLLNPYFIIKN